MCVCTYVFVCVSVCVCVCSFVCVCMYMHMDVCMHVCYVGMSTIVNVCAIILLWVHV